MLYLTSIRGIAALLVVLYHIKIYLNQYESAAMFSWLYNKGYLAVDFFFILSGFIIAFNYKKVFESKLKSSALIGFIIKRFARIYPLHLFILLCYLLVPTAYLLTDRTLQTSQFSGGGFIAKLFMVDVWVIGQNLWESWNVPSWTISGEFFAYLLFPFFCLVIKKRKLAAVALYFLSIIVIAFSYEYHGNRSLGDGISELGLLRCVGEFLCGMCIYEFRQNFPSLTAKANRNITITVSVALIFLLLTIEKNHFYIPFLFSFLLYGFIGFRSFVHKLLELKVFVKLGDISYSVYLSHTLILTMYTMIFVSNVSEFSFVDAIAYICITIAFSILTYRCVEVPMRRHICRRLLSPTVS